MDTKINFIKNKVKKHHKKFSLFFTLGIIRTGIAITLTWLLIDILKVSAVLGSTIVVFIVFFITYFVYVMARIIKPRFIKYTSITIGFNIATVLLIWFFVDFIGFSGVLSSTITVGILFILRYFFFNKVGLIQHD